MGTSSATGSFTKPAMKPLVPDPNWKRCEGEDHCSRVITKEQAAKKAISALKKMLNTLTMHLLATPTCQTRINKIHEILARKKEFRVMVGFLGMTGAGKSTLVNALIGCRDLLPSSSWRASMAVITELNYNKSSDPDKLFRAEVVYLSAAEWRSELESIFEDIHAEQASATEGDGENEVDEERKGRIKQSFDKIKCVYPHINTRAKLDSASVEELLAPVSPLLGSTKLIEKRTRPQLSDEIRQYIDSGDNTASVHWPLVSVVRLFVKSSVLEPGVVIVDLPGNLDSNAARSAIAEKYSKHLAVSVVVANVSRGISEKNAADLLEKFTKRGLQLDGLYTADSLCFVLSQTDRDFDMVQYARQYPDLGKDLAADQKYAWHLKGDIAELERERTAAKKAHRKNTKSVEELSAEIKKITSRLSALSSNDNPLPLRRKRRINDTEEAPTVTNASEVQIELRNNLVELQLRLSNLKDTVQSESKDLISYGRRITSKQETLLFAQSRFMVQCIRHRNDMSSAAITSDYNATLQEMGRQPNKDLQVFPVSATMHLRYQNSKKRPLGFPNRKDTHISALQDWLHGTTLNDRERYAQDFLEDVDEFLASIQPWIMDKYGENKMPCELRGYWEPRMESLVSDLEADLHNLTIETEASMKHLVQTNIYSIVPQAEKSAGAKARYTARKWAMACHWSTHRKINSKRGLWTDYKGRNYKWNNDLVHDFTTHLVQPWDLTFHRQFPQEKINYVDVGKVLISDFAHIVANKDIFPDASDDIDVLKERIMKTQNRLRSETDTAFEEMKKLIKRAHKLATPAVWKFLEPMYEHCASQSGTGFYLRNKKYIDNFMTHNGVPMHRVGKNAIKQQLNRLLDNVPVRLGQGNALILRQIREEIKFFFDRNSTDGSRMSTRKVVSNAKVALQKDLLADINALADDWKLKVQVEEIHDDDEIEDEMTFDDGLFVNLSKGDGDSDYADSDGETN